MGTVRNLFLGNPENAGMKYRIRVFDHGHFITKAEVPDRGQDNIKLVVKKKDFMLFGEEVKLQFMINPEIRPFIFGNVMEINFDIRDSTQLADIFDYYPDLVRQINGPLYEQLSKEKKGGDHPVQDAEFTEKTEKEGEEKKEEPVIDPLNELLEEEVIEEEEQEESAGVKAINYARDNIKAILKLNDISRAKESEIRTELVRQAFVFAEEHPKSLRWLPRYLHVEPEVTAIVAQTELDGVGIRPMYYTRQSSAEITEKMFQRPKAPEDWKMGLIYVAAALGVLIICAGVILKLLGKI
jgi:hypothetical protein